MFTSKTALFQEPTLKLNVSDSTDHYIMHASQCIINCSMH